jgi:hypothetical protein
LNRQGRQARQEEQEITGEWESGAFGPDSPPRISRTAIEPPRRQEIQK